LVARDFDGQARVERGDAPDRRGLPAWIALAEDHVVDSVRFDAGALE
jgi:hypothetical protein